VGRGRLAVCAVVLTAAGCGGQHSSTTGTAGIPSALLHEARPIGHGPRFHPPATGSVIGPCRRRIGRRDGVHVELFAANRVVLLAAGIGVRPPFRVSEGRIAEAACYGDLVTLEPTGVVLLRPGSRLTLAAVFRAWGQPLTARRLASFRASRQGVRTYVNGRPWTKAPGAVPLTRHAEIVLEVGPHVPPHVRYTFPPGT
jgi:hypothetical protein